MQEKGGIPQQLDLFADFNGLPDAARLTEFYQHDANWTNRMIRGDSLQVMASLTERERLRGKVQCIYTDPPYGIKFNSNSGYMAGWDSFLPDVFTGSSDGGTGFAHLGNSKVLIAMFLALKSVP